MSTWCAYEGKTPSTSGRLNWRLLFFNFAPTAKQAAQHNPMKSMLDSDTVDFKKGKALGDL